MDQTLGNGAKVVGVRLYSKVCKYCGETCYRKNKAEASRLSWNYCSHSCRTSNLNQIYKWNKGKTISLEVRKKISLIKRGKPNYKSRLITGKRHWNWQGGKTGESRKQRNIAAYKDWRKSVFEKDNYTCVLCGNRNYKGNGKTVKLNADHIKPFAFFPELRYEISNGRTLCLSCHKKTPTFAIKSLKQYEAIILE